MAGLLDGKSRMMDTVITLEGKRQLASGKMRIEYVSFTDTTDFYEADAVSGSSDAGSRVHFEASSLAHDAIAFEADDSGLLQASPGLFRDGIGVFNGKVVIADDDTHLTMVTGSVFASSGTRLLKASLDNFSRLRVLGSAGPFDDDTEFVLSRNDAQFFVTDKAPIDVTAGLADRLVDTLGDLYSDDRLTHLTNFMYLPPVNMPTSPDALPKQLGQFVPLGPTKALTPDDIETELAQAKAAGRTVDIEFAETSRANNVFAQFFEIGPTDLVKLDVIDYGNYALAGSASTKRVLFAGKMYQDAHGVSVFAHLFTLVFYSVDAKEMF